MVARPESDILYAFSFGWIRGSNDNDTDGPQGAEDDNALH